MERDELLRHELLALIEIRVTGRSQGQRNPSQSWSFSHSFRKTYLGYRGFIRGSTLRSVAKGWFRTRTPDPG